jgi:Protein of unknown function (DUF2927)
LRFVRAVAAACWIAVLATAVYGGGQTINGWLTSDALGLVGGLPARFSPLDRFAAREAGQPGIRRFFTTVVFTQHTDQTTAPGALVLKWDRPRVSIKLLNSDGPQVTAFLEQLVAQLNGLQQQVRFTTGGDGPPAITVQFLPHEAYVAGYGTATVGETRTRYFTDPRGLIAATIAIDTGLRDTPELAESTLIHELGHAIGLSGHFYLPASRWRSVMYQSNTLIAWTPSDVAAIRLLYSPPIEAGMSPAQAQAALRDYARAASSQ